MPSHPEEHPGDIAWYSLTGPQRRLVDAYLGDLERGVDLMDQLNLSPVTAPDAQYLASTYGAAEKDADAVAQFLADSRRRDAMTDKVRNILNGHGNGES